MRHREHTWPASLFWIRWGWKKLGAQSDLLWVILVTWMTALVLGYIQPR